MPRFCIWGCSMNKIRFFRGTQADLDKLIRNANAFPIEEEESDSENETKTLEESNQENELKK